MKNICELIIAPTRQRPRNEWKGLKRDEGIDAVDVAVFDIPANKIALDCYVKGELKGVQFNKVKIESDLDAGGISQYLETNEHTFAYAPRGSGFYECLNSINKNKLVKAFQEHPLLGHVFPRE